jgi:hypothetical protein
MIYTTYEMIRDCRAGKKEGWAFYEANYVPILRRLAAHYGRDVPDLRDHLFASLAPMPERHFIAALRQKFAESAGAGQPGGLDPEKPGGLDLETLGRAWTPLTVVEKKAAWLETMHYSADDAARMLRMDEKTVQKVRDKAADLLRAAMDRWSRTLLEENGDRLGRAAAAKSTPECVSAKALLDMIDGRSTWTKREEAERHITGCWHCVDHFCRLHEVCDMLRQ